MPAPAAVAHAAAVVVSAVVACVAAAGCMLLFLQPWRSCPEIDNSSAGCPALPRDVALLQVCVIVFAVAVLILAIALIRLDTPPPTGHATAGKPARTAARPPVRYGLVGEPGSDDDTSAPARRNRP